MEERSPCPYRYICEEQEMDDHSVQLWQRLNQEAVGSFDSPSSCGILFVCWHLQVSISDEITCPSSRQEVAYPAALWGSHTPFCHIVCLLFSLKWQGSSSAVPFLCFSVLRIWLHSQMMSISSLCDSLLKPWPSDIKNLTDRSMHV